MFPLIDPVVPLFFFFSLWPVPEAPYKCDHYRVKLSDICLHGDFCAPIRPHGCFSEEEIEGIVFCCEVENPQKPPESCEWPKETLETSWLCGEA